MFFPAPAVGDVSEQAAEQLGPDGQILDGPLHEQRGEEHHEHDGEQVFDDEYAEDQRGEFPVPQPQIVERLDDALSGRNPPAL